MRRAMLWGKILHSPLAHPRIVRIDASDARNLVGVKATNVVAEAVWCFGFFWFCRLYYGPRHHPAMKSASQPFDESVQRLIGTWSSNDPRPGARPDGTHRGIYRLEGQQLW